MTSTLERTQTRFRPTVAVIDLDAVRHNVRAVAPDGVEFMAVVKANGYGHGAPPVAKAALEGGATWLGVALVEEGLRLRDAGIDAPILVLTEFPPGSEGDALRGRLTPTVYTDGGLDRAVHAARALGLAPPPVHVKVDTGMHRVGLRPEAADALVGRVLEAGCPLDGLWTHFAKSEDLEDDVTDWQLGTFLGVARRLAAVGIRPRLLHAANSAAAIARPGTRLDVVRVGVATYGLSPGVPGPELRPALSWRSAVSLAKRVPAGHAVSYGHQYRLEREATIATVPVGYADGYSRLLSNRAAVLIRGRRYPVAGTVTMDQVLVDCGDDPVEPGDEVVLIGRQGSEEITADELAGMIGTINYEIVCGLSERVPREYLGAS